MDNNQADQDEYIVKIRETSTNGHFETILNNLTVEENNEPNLIKHSPYYIVEDLTVPKLKDSTQFSVLSLNTQSINAKIDELLIMLTTIREQNIQFDAICIQETWLDSTSDASFVQIPGYNCISQGKYCSGHGGLITYVKEDFSYKILDNLHEKSQIWEGLFIEIDTQANEPNLIIGNIYKPPKNQKTVENTRIFTTEFGQVLEKLESTKGNIIIAGDYNLNLLEINEKQYIAEFYEKMLQYTFYPAITLPTRTNPMNNKGSLIDNFYCKLTDSSTQCTAGILYTKVSDHLPYFISVKLSGIKIKAPPKTAKQKVNVTKVMVAFKEETA